MDELEQILGQAIDEACSPYQHSISSGGRMRRDITPQRLGRLLARVIENVPGHTTVRELRDAMAAHGNRPEF